MTGEDALVVVQRVLFVGTLLVELLALRGAAQCRARFETGDPGRTTWTLFTAFLAVRVIAEIRLLTLYFELVPGLEGTPWGTLYVVVLRYLYTVSDLCVVVGLVGMIRTLRGLGLPFSLRVSDFVAMALVAALPVVALALRERLTDTAALAADQAILAYRMVAVSLTAIVAMLCIAILRYARQMQGGALARIWGAIVVAGLARTASFVGLAIVGGAWGNVAEQVLLLVFALAWLRAGGEQRRLLPEAVTPQ
jgi:hypothetical protein